MRIGITLVLAALCTGCAGRDPQPVATVQLTDANATCAMIVAEIEANNIKVRELAGEEGAKVAQNVAAGVAGIVIPVLWFGMDFKGAASKEVAALQAAPAISHDIIDRTVCAAARRSTATPHSIGARGVLRANSAAKRSNLPSSWAALA